VPCPRLPQPFSNVNFKFSPMLGPCLNCPLLLSEAVPPCRQYCHLTGNPILDDCVGTTPPPSHSSPLAYSSFSVISSANFHHEGAVLLSPPPSLYRWSSAFPFNQGLYKPHSRPLSFLLRGFLLYLGLIYSIPPPLTLSLLGTSPR